MRDWAIELAASVPMVMFSSALCRLSPSKAVLIWAKGEHTGMGDLSFPWKPDYEEIYIFGEGFRHERRPCRQFQTELGRLAERAIPLLRSADGLMRTLIAGMIIPNLPRAAPGIPFGPEAAKRLGRRAIGIEIEERYCEIAAKRCAQGVLNFA